MGRKRKTEDDYHKKAATLGLIWIGTLSGNTSSSTRWQCPGGHTWATSYTNLRGCPTCYKTSDRNSNYRRKKKSRDYELLAAQKHFDWIGDLPSSVNKKTLWQCPDGHTWMTSYHNLRGCPTCYHASDRSANNRRRLKSSDYHALAILKGITWLGPEAANSHTKTWWRCSCGYEWDTAIENVRKSKTGCPRCSGNVSKTPEDYHVLALERGHIWLGPEVARNKDKTWWQCANGHEWEAHYQSIHKGVFGCPHCARNHPLTKDDYHNLAASNNFTWAGPEVPTARTKTNWRCQYGHEWSIAHFHIRRGDGCPYCAGVARKTQQDYLDIAAKVGITLLGNAPTSIIHHAKWQCAAGHIWETSYAVIYNAEKHGTTGCPHCAGMDFENGALVSQPQRDLRAMLGGELNFYSGDHYIDIAIEHDGIRIACEYDGWYWHQDAAKDARRNENIINAGWRLLVVKSGELLPTEDQLNTAIDALLDGATYYEIVLDDWQDD